MHNSEVWIIKAETFTFLHQINKKELYGKALLKQLIKENLFKLQIKSQGHPTLKEHLTR